MAQYQDHVVVLRSRPYREADSLVTLFGIRTGKVGAVAKGIRRPKSPLAGALQPLSYSQVGLYQGRSSLETVTDAELVDGFSRLANDLTRLTWAMALADLVDELWAEHESSPETLSLLVGALEALNGGKPPAAVGLAAGWQFLRIAGYLPHWAACAQCGESIRRGPVQVDLSSSDILCGGCRREGSPGKKDISLGSLRSLQYWMALPPERLGLMEAKGQIKDECLALWMLYARYQIGKSPRSFDFLASVELAEGSGRSRA